MEEQLNIQRGAIPTPPPAQQTTTATFEFPTQIISLPSEGKVYEASNPLSKGTLEIKYLTAKEEDILSDRNLITKGVVLDKLLESVVVERGVNADDLLIGDKNAIYLAARVLGYGPEYLVEVSDPFSGERQKVSIDLSAVQTKDIDYSKLSPTNRYDFELPSGTKITFKLLTHKDEKDINAELQALARLSKGKVSSTEVTTRLKYMIVAVNGNSDRGYVNGWVTNQFLAKDVKAFREYVKLISPDLNMKYDFVSDITGETEALDIPFGVDFFYPTT